MTHKTLKITLYNNWVVLYFLIFILIGFIIILIYLNFQSDFLFIFTILFLIQAIPAMYLYLEYWFQNKNEKYEIYADKLIKYKKNKKEQFDIEDIEQVIIFTSPSLYQNWYIHFFAIEQYHFARIYLKNGKKLIITCLLASRVDKALLNLKGIKIEKKKWLFNSIYTPESWY